MTLDIFITEEIGSAACSNYQVIVRKTAIIGFYQLMFSVDVFYFGYTHVHIILSLKNFAQRERYGARLEPGCGHLVKQRLKLVEVELVY